MSALLLRYLGLPGIAIVAILGYYEGVPFVGKYTSSAILSGRVETYAREQVRSATSEMVSKYELLSKEAELRREKILREASEKENRELLDVREKALERLRDLEASSGQLRPPTQEELKWFDQNFSR